MLAEIPVDFYSLIISVQSFHMEGCEEVSVLVEGVRRSIPVE